jgi:hypothetical protein
MADLKARVSLEFDPSALDESRVVLSAALSLFTSADGVEVVLSLVDIDEPTPEQAEWFVRTCPTLVRDATQLPDIVLLGAAEAAEQDCLLRLSAGADPVVNAHGIALLTALAQALWDKGGQAHTTITPIAPGTTPEMARRARGRFLRAEVGTAIARRDLARVRQSAGRPHVVVLSQYRSYWGALQTVCEALSERDDVVLNVVALQPANDAEPGLTAQFLRERGYAPQDETWLLEHLDSIDVAIIDHPYDELRSAPLRSSALAAMGIRLAYLPYCTPTADGVHQQSLMYDLPLHQRAWRVFARSPRQAEMYARYGSVGNDHVRVLGLPKLDRLVNPPAARTPGSARLSGQIKGRRTVLWNAHFTVAMGDRTLSTFDSYVEQLVGWFVAHPDVVLLFRPHFNLFPRLRALGNEGVAMERNLRATAARHRNVILDETPDYLDAFTVADAMISDASSLITEFMPSRKPVLYLHSDRGPGYNEDAAYFDDLYQARSWQDVERFLRMVVASDDPMRQQREASLTTHFHALDGRAGERIADHIVTHLQLELGLSTQRVGNQKKMAS